MIPLKLHIKNFLSYGPQTQIIDFEPYHLICLSGKNGHGKSALLDAITWALWGQARKVAGTLKADAQLLHLGQTHMMVLLDFSSNGNIYRIKREYAKTYGKSGAALDFGIIDKHTGVFNALTTTTIRTTQETIENMIGVSYESFINSAFLRQGSSNEFSKKSPKDRKEILSTILGLQQYEQIRKIALEKIKNLQLSIATSNVSQEKLRTQLLTTSTVHEQMKMVNNNFQAIEEQEKIAATLHAHFTQQERTLAHKVNTYLMQFEQKSHHQKQHQQERHFLAQKIIAWRTQLHQAKQAQRSWHKESLNEIHEQCIKAQIDCQQATLLHQAITTITTSRTAIQHQLSLDHQIDATKISTAIQLARNQLDFTLQQEKALSKELLQAQAQEQKIAASLLSLQQQALTHTDPPLSNPKKNSTESAAERFEKHKNYFHSWTTRANKLTTKLKQLVSKDLLTIDQENASCPLCEQSLRPEHHQRLTTKLAKQQHLLQHQLDRFTIVLPALKQNLVTQHNALILQAKKEQELLRINTLLTELTNQHNDQKKIVKNLLEKIALCALQIAHLQATLAQTEQQHKELTLRQAEELINHKEIQILTTQLNENKEALAQLNHQEPQHQALIKIQQHLLEQQKNRSSLEHEILSYPHKLQEFLGLLDGARLFKKETQEIEHLGIEVSLLENTYEATLVQQKKNQELLADLRKQKEEVLEKRGRLAQAQKHLEQEAQELQAIEQKHACLLQNLDDHQIISTALSKDGIQALFIEDAIPEIECEANKLLAQLSDNQAQIFIDSLRDLKSGGTKETLDIKISDAAGIRPYELFSGGEAFRIDFALRIAISRLLARRTGTSLQTLIIDEGFGSQDAEGLANIMDAIHRIQDNFCKVIIVSHLATMQEQFPVHFVVSKESQGSLVRVIQQG